ncbi:MAG: hypothetical protein ACRCZO_20190 [Cetobacterium sp.]
MAIPKEATKRLRYFAGLLTALEAVVNTPYLKYMRGRKLGPFPTRQIDYRTVATKNQAASLIGFRKIEGQKLRPIGFDEYTLTPGIIAQSETITASEADLMRADSVIFVNQSQLDAEEQIYRDKAYNIKEAIELRKNIMVAQLIHNGEYVSFDGRKVAFPIRPVDTLDYTEHGKFLVEYKKQLRAFIKVHGKRPTDVLVGEEIVNELLRDKIFMEEVYKLGLANFGEDDKKVVIARVLGTLLEEEAPAFDPDLEIDAAKGNRITLMDCSRLHPAYGGLEIIQGTTPMMVASEYLAHEKIDHDNQSVDFVARSAFSPVLSDANAIWRIEVDLPTQQQRGLIVSNNENELPKTKEELDEVINRAIEETLKKAQEANAEMVNKALEDALKKVEKNTTKKGTIEKNNPEDIEKTDK